MSASGVTSMQNTVGRMINRQEPLRQSAGELVGSVFYGKLLSQMRDSKIKGKYGHGGRGEEMFAAQLHGLIAENMGKAERGGLREAVYKSLEKQQRLMDQQRKPMAKDVLA